MSWLHGQGYKCLVSSPEPEFRWENNIKMDPKETVCKDTGLIKLVEGTVH